MSKAFEESDEKDKFFVKLNMDYAAPCDL